MESRFKSSIHSNLEICEACDTVINTFDKESVRDHDLRCPTRIRKKFYDLKRKEEAKKCVRNNELLDIEKEKSNDLWEKVNKNRLKMRPMSTYNAYSESSLPMKGSNAFNETSSSDIMSFTDSSTSYQCDINANIDDDQCSSKNVSYSSRPNKRTVISITKNVTEYGSNERHVISELEEMNAIKLNRLNGKVSFTNDNLESDDDSTTILDETASHIEEHCDDIEFIAKEYLKNIDDDEKEIGTCVDMSKGAGGITFLELYTPTLREEFNNQSCLLRMMANNEFQMSSKYYYSSREKCYLELAQILQSMNMPSRAYKEIIQWAQRSKPKDLINPIGRKTLIKQFAEKQGLSGIFPHTELMSLPSGNIVKVTKFDFASQLMSLLTENVLMQEQNFILGGDLFKKAEPVDFRGDIDTGEWFINTQKELCKQPNDILCPLILYIDKTHVNNHGVEAISFTLGK